MMSIEQMMLGATPTFDLVTNPLNGCVLLNSQPVYYGLETIVQNTVMQSQQFVSTAMQGVLSQNSSFSATTTQVFQASKIEPIMEMQPSYVVLNNDGTIMQPQATQQQMLPTNILQQALPQLQTTQNPQAPTWRFYDDKSTMLQTSQNANDQTILNAAQHSANNLQGAAVTTQPPNAIQPVQMAQPITSQPQPVTPNKLTQSKPALKQRSTKQFLAQKSTANKPIIKSSPIIVNKTSNSFIENDLHITHPPKVSNETFVLPNTVMTKTTTNNSNIANEAKSVSKPITVATTKQSKVTKPITNALKVTPATIKPKAIKKASIEKTKQVLNSIQSQSPSITITTLPQIPLKPETSKCTKSSIYATNENNLTFGMKNKEIKSNIQIDKIETLPITTKVQTNFASKPVYNSSQPNLSSTSAESKSLQINTSSTNSIQLPTAPYAPSFANGIPTNVVNPIQQYNTNRPTNRVLPMQNVQLKISAASNENSVQTKTEKPAILEETKPAKLPNEENKEIKMNAEAPKHEPMEIDSTEEKDDEIKIELPLDGNSNHSDSDSSESAFKESFFPTYSAEEAFDKLKQEDDVAMNNMKKDNTEIVVKNAAKENFENDIKSKDIDDLESENQYTMLETASVHSDSKSSVINEVNDQKENISPVVEQNHLKLQNVFKETPQDFPKSHGPKLLYEIQSQDGFTYKSTSITDVWEKVFEAVQMARKAHGLSPLPVGPLADMCGFQMLGLKTNALKYLLEQLPGVERCTNYKSTYHNRAESTISQASSSGYWSDYDELKESSFGTARCEQYKGRSEYDMFSWLASRHRKQPIQICVPQYAENDAIPRRGSGSNLPMAMRYRTLKETYKDSVGVYRSHIHGRGLFCNRDIEAGKY